MSTEPPAQLRGGLPHGVEQVSSAILVLHGGRQSSLEPTASRQLSVLRMVDMYVGLRRHSRGAAVYLLRHRVRGWNPDASGRVDPDPVLDARWAIDRLTERHGDVPIGLLGHSMGGRTAFAVAEEPRVVGVCGLAPWLPSGEPVPHPRPDQRFVIAHGTSDRTTSAPASLGYAERLRAAGGTVARFELEGAGHALLDRPLQWHRFAVAVTLGLVGDRDLPAAVQAAFAAAAPASRDGLREPLATVASA